MKRTLSWLALSIALCIAMWLQPYSSPAGWILFAATGVAVVVTIAAFARRSVSSPATEREAANA
jgi:membrane protein implicated in regulation of membrane protease activity